MFDARPKQVELVLCRGHDFVQEPELSNRLQCVAISRADFGCQQSFAIRRGQLRHRDFVVRVYAAIVTDEKDIERTPTCAVVPPSELAAWIQALPTQRGLNAERREWLAETVAGIAAGS